MKKLITLIFLSMIAINAIHAEVTWTLSDDGTMTISGTDMPDYPYFKAPWYSQRDNIKKVVINNGVTNIGKCAFYECLSITSVTIPNSVTSIGDEAFEYCFYLTSITIPNSVTSIGNRAVSSCSRLTSIIVEKGNNTYDSRNNCNAIIETKSNTLIAGCKNTFIPETVTSIGASAFFGCPGLTSINIPETVTSIGDMAFIGCTRLTSITIPKSVTSIGESAFSDCSNLTSITIPNYTSIGGNAFNETKWYENQPDGLVYIGIALYKYKGTMPEKTNIVIKEGIKEISGSAFANCSGLTSITIPNSVTSIGKHAFRNCSDLTSITISNSLTSIGMYAFSNCSGLTSITIPNSVISIGQDAFHGCSSLTSVTIPNSVTDIEFQTFASCSGLTSITIPNSVTSIGQSAFYGCKGLTSIIIPNSVTSIGGAAFADCSGLTTITCEATTPPNCLAECFYNVKKNIPVYVPSKSVNSYKKADVWKYFYNLQAIDYTVTLDNNKGIGGSEQVTVVYNQPMPEDIGLVAPTRKGYDFTGYSIGEKYYYDANMKSVRNYDYKKDCTFYANWKAHTSKINFDFQGGKNGTSKIIATYDSAMPTGIDVVAPTRDGYTFGGYYDNKDGNGTQYYNADMTSKNPWDKDISEITLYAKWFVIPVTDISLNVATVSLWVGDTKELSATATPTTAYNTTVNWYSSNNNVATVSSKGVITAKGKGICTITCTAADGYGAKSTCEVTVKQQVASINLSEATASLWVGKTKTITATISPTTASNTAVNWSSSDNSVATVSSKGVVTAKGKGTCTITCKAADGYGTKSTCNVTVKQQVNSIDFGYETLTIACGEEKTLTPTINPSNADVKTLTWKSTDKSVATITSEGVLTAVSPGTATITCTATDDFKKSSSITVIVEPLDITITDKNPTIKDGTYREGSISYTRTLTNNKYTTFYMPYDVNLSDYTDYFSNVYVPVEMAFVESDGKLKVMFKSVSLTETIRAGQPFIALASKSGTVAIKNGSKITIKTLDEPQPINLEVYNYGGTLLARNTDVDVQITGTYSVVTDLDNANNFTFYTNGQIISATTVSPYRFYITKNDERSSAKITDILLSFDGEEATGIDEIINEQKDDDKFYNLNGQRINHSNAQKGVYIKNGKKYAK